MVNVCSFVIHSGKNTKFILNRLLVFFFIYFNFHKKMFVCNLDFKGNWEDGFSIATNLNGNYQNRLVDIILVITDFLQGCIENT